VTPSIENLPVAIGIANLERWCFVNRAMHTAAERAGWAQLPESLLLWTDPFDRATVEEDLQRCLATQRPLLAQTRMLSHANGSVLPVSLSYSPINQDGSPAVQVVLLFIVEQLHTATGQPTPDLTQLTTQEMRVAVKIAQGYANVNLALLLGVSENTIRSHLRQLYRKLGLQQRGALSRVFGGFPSSLPPFASAAPPKSLGSLPPSPAQTELDTLERAPIPVFVHQGGRLLWANQLACAWLGYFGVELAVQPSLETFFPPEQRAAFLERCRRIEDGEHEVHGEPLVMCLPDGHPLRIFGCAVRCEWEGRSAVQVALLAGPSTASERLFGRLSEGELSLLSALLSGMSLAEAACALGMPTRRAQACVKTIHAFTGTRRLSELIDWARIALNETSPS
jgi:DNA-binding CsgD family transcriptional regulator